MAALPPTCSDIVDVQFCSAGSGVVQVEAKVELTVELLAFCSHHILRSLHSMLVPFFQMIHEINHNPESRFSATESDNMKGGLLLFHCFDD
jgi:hypothetical protein